MRTLLACLVAVVCALALSLVARHSAVDASGVAATSDHAKHAHGNASTHMGCNAPHDATQLSCFGQVRARLTALGITLPLVSTTPVGYGPAQLTQAYRLPASTTHATVAIVDAFDDPLAEQDLAVYRETFGLPPCTTSNGCLRKVNQHGTDEPLPSADFGWSQEVSLDVDMVSAICPSCRIALVEANTPSVADFSAAENAAASLRGVAVISNSFGGPEAQGTHAADRAFHHPGVAITASSGDDGFLTSWPASAPFVTAVGGTTLAPADNSRGWSETAWSGSGSGCSPWEPKPAWQHDPDCHKRSIADVAAVADPDTGVAVYDTYSPCSFEVCPILTPIVGDTGPYGWFQDGGTSVAAPIIAGVYALAGNTRTVDASYPYRHASQLLDVTSGSTGDCSGFYTCTAGPGYDGPTGLGTPNGTGAF